MISRDDLANMFSSAIEEMTESKTTEMYLVVDLCEVSSADLRACKSAIAIGGYTVDVVLGPPDSDFSDYLILRAPENSGQNQELN